jgi:uncharacterized protein (DUF2062 family)
VVFRRRNQRTLLEWAREFVYPRGGFRRAAQYLTHRLRRLPDEPHRIARGVFAGVFVSFTPLFGFHFLLAGLLGWVMRGNIIAALLATFVGNPLTTPFIAITSVELGHRILGIDAPMDVMSIIAAFTNAGSELWHNARALFTSDVTHWENLATFFGTIFWPYLVGGLLPGLAVSLAFYWATIPIVRAYQRIRAGQAKDRLEKRLRLKSASMAAPPSSGDDGRHAAP